MATTTETAPAPKGKKKLLIIIIAVVVLALGGGAAFFLLGGKKKGAGAEATEPAAEAPSRAEADQGGGGAKTPPTYLPLDNMVVNLSDPGGTAVAQIGITLEVMDAKAGEKIKGFLPTIRSGVLLIISERTATDLLTREGKERLAEDILEEVSKPLGYASLTERDRKPAYDKEGKLLEPKRPFRVRGNPVQGVLFSSFIVQQ